MTDYLYIFIVVLHQPLLLTKGDQVGDSLERYNGDEEMNGTLVVASRRFNVTDFAHM